MKSKMKTIRYMLYFALFFGAVWVSVMGYDQVMLARSENTPDLTTWLPKKEIARRMQMARSTLYRKLEKYDLIN